MTKPMLTVRDVADQLGMTPKRVRRLIRSRRLRALNLSSNETVPRYAIDRLDLQRFLDAAVVGANGAISNDSGASVAEGVDGGDGGTADRHFRRRARRRAPSSEAVAIIDDVMKRRKGPA